MRQSLCAAAVLLCIATPAPAVLAPASVAEAISGTRLNYERLQEADKLSAEALAAGLEAIERLPRHTVTLGAR